MIPYRCAICMPWAAEIVGSVYWLSTLNHGWAVVCDEHYLMFRHPHRPGGQLWE